MKTYDLYRDGQWVKPIIDDFIEVENPATKEVIGRVPAAHEEDVELAIEGAKKALSEWSSLKLEDRIDYIEKILEYLKDKKEDIAKTIHEELGSPIEFSKETQTNSYFPHIEDYIRLAKDYKFVEKFDGYEVHKEPVGVVACLTPWNYPLGQIVKKVIPALLTGNTVVLKPSQSTPITAYYVMEAAHQAKLPKGVLQLVTGRGSEVGNIMAKNIDINKISYTGSTKGGSSIYSQAAGDVKRITLELGGKSPAVLLEGADYEKALRLVLNTVYFNTGQTCSAKTRLIAPRKDKEKIEELLVKLTKEYKFGDPKDKETQVGPLQSKKQLEKVTSLVAIGKTEAEVLYEAEAYSDKGYYFGPVIFTEVSPDAKIAQEEIFGPVLSVIYYDSVEEAVEIANNSIYGLAGMVFGKEEDAKEIAMKIKSGQVQINGASTTLNAPFGGFKQSGIGREGSKFGFEEYIELKTIFV